MSIVVTAVGALTPYGPGLGALVDGIALEKSEVRPGPTGPRAMLPELDFKALLGAKGLRSVDRVGLMALLACQEALADSGLDSTAYPTELGVVLGTAFGGLSSINGFFKERLSEGPRLVTASNFGNIVMNAPASQVAVRHGLTALNATLTSGSASGLDAVGWALDFIQDGRARAVLAGGTDELSKHALATLAALGWPADGYVPGEASVVWLLEREEDLANRKALARVLAHAAAFDSGPLVGRRPDASVAARNMRSALKRSGKSPNEVEWLSTGACGLPALDAATKRAIGEVFEARIPERLFSAHPWVGDTLAASGPLAASLAVHHLASPGGPALALVHVSSPSGHHASLVLERLRPHGERSS